MKYCIFKYNTITKDLGDFVEFVEGEMIPKNKSNPEISSGYMYYIKSGNEYKKYSAFHYIVREVKDEIED